MSKVLYGRHFAWNSISKSVKKNCWGGGGLWQYNLITSSCVWFVGENYSHAKERQNIKTFYVRQNVLCNRGRERKNAWKKMVQRSQQCGDTTEIEREKNGWKITCTHTRAWKNYNAKNGKDKLYGWEEEVGSTTKKNGANKFGIKACIVLYHNRETTESIKYTKSNWCQSINVIACAKATCPCLSIQLNNKRCMQTERDRATAPNKNSISVSAVLHSIEKQLHIWDMVYIFGTDEIKYALSSSCWVCIRVLWWQWCE